MRIIRIRNAPMNTRSSSLAVASGAAAPALDRTSVQRLDQAPNGCVYTVRQVHVDPHVPERARQLEEIGFSPGEQVMVMARGFLGGDPLVVRVGQSTFALRSDEAACIQLEGTPGTPAA
jgi:ferrous iron transport protein A